MAPEQAEDAHSADSRADVYSLGCTLFYLLTGTIPYPASTALKKVLAHRDRPVPSLRRIRADVPAELDALVARMMAKNPAKRLQTAREAAGALEPFAGGTKSGGPGKTSRVGWMAAGFLGVGLLVGLAVYRIQTDQGELVIATDRKDVKVVVSRGGELVRVIDTETNTRITLHSGTYDLELKDAPDGLKLKLDKATLTRGKTVLATFEWVPKPAPAVKEEPAKTARIELVRRFTVPAVSNLHYDTGVSKDGRYAFVTRDIAPGCELTLYNVSTGDRILTCSGYMASFLDSEHLVVDGDHKFRVYEIKSGTLLREGPRQDFHALVVAPNQKHLFYTNSKGLVLFDLTGMRDQHTFVGTPASGEFSADGKRLFVSVDGGKSFQVWDAENNRAAEDYAWLKQEAWGFRFLPDGKRVRTFRGGQYADRDAATGKVLETRALPKLPPGSLFNVVYREHFMLAGFEDGSVRMLAVPGGQEIARYQLSPEDPIVRVGWHTRIAVSSDDQYASVVTRTSVWVLRLPPGPAVHAKP
jgi:hypothetical protein